MDPFVVWNCKCMHTNNDRDQRFYGHIRSIYTYKYNQMNHG
jgi:hypothetical protein